MRLVIAGAGSGVGKTTFTVGLCRALRRRGSRVAVFKCGPDYLDPTWHARASGRAVHNLDGWLMGRDAVRETFARTANDVDVALIEGVMGLFDGADASSLTGSTAEIAQWLEAPTLLVCDARGMARSAAALAHGFATYHPDVKLHGLICNRVGSAGHLDLLRRAPSQVPVLGGMTRRAEHAFPERHLGLYSAHQLDPRPAFDAFADEIEAHCDLDRILALARCAPRLPAPTSRPPSALSRPARCRIGIARDAAFHFYYDANLHLLERAGAELVDFSPIADSRLPPVDGLYIGGGYPELHAPELAANQPLMAAIRAFAAHGRPIYAECGGLMYLSQAIVDHAGERHAMLGLIGGTAIMTDRLQALGYVEVATQQPTLLGPTGTRFRGHQFRHSRFEGPTPHLYELTSARSGAVSCEGYGSSKLVASYVHAHWASTPAIAEAFIEHCTR